jgi:hypothetical protein
MNQLKTVETRVHYKIVRSIGHDVLNYIYQVCDSQSLLRGQQVVRVISRSGPRILIQNTNLCFADHQFELREPPICVRGPPNYSKWSTHRKSLGTTVLSQCETFSYPDFEFRELSKSNFQNCKNLLQNILGFS